MTDRSIVEQHTAQYKRQLIQLMLFLCYFLSIPSHLSVERVLSLHIVDQSCRDLLRLRPPLDQHLPRPKLAGQGMVGH